MTTAPQMRTDINTPHRPVAALMLIGSMVLGASVTPVVHAATPVGLCKAEEKVIFSCPTKAKKIIALCASPNFSAKAGTLQYRFGTPTKVELQYPETPQPAAGKFFASQTGYSGGGELRVRFKNGSVDYFLFDRTIRTGFSGTNNPEFTSGVIVRTSKGVTTIKCTDDDGFKASASELLPNEEFDDLD